MAKWKWDKSIEGSSGLKERKGKKEGSENKWSIAPKKKDRLDGQIML